MSLHMIGDTIGYESYKSSINEPNFVLLVFLIPAQIKLQYYQHKLNMVDKCTKLAKSSFKRLQLNRTSNIVSLSICVCAGP